MASDTSGLKTIAEGYPESFWNSVVSDGNKRPICGLSATFAELRLLDDAQGKVHKYSFAPDPAGGIFSFAGTSFQPSKRTLLSSFLSAREEPRPDDLAVLLRLVVIRAVLGLGRRLLPRTRAEDWLRRMR